MSDGDLKNQNCVKQWYHPLINPLKEHSVVYGKLC